MLNLKMMNFHVSQIFKYFCVEINITLSLG